MLGLVGSRVPLHAASAKNSTGNATASSSYTSPAAPNVSTDPAHVLHPQDVLRVQVFQEDDISKQCDGLAVSQDSTITLPLIGVLSVKNKTVREVQDLIRTLYDQDYLVNPQVSLVVLKYADRWVNVVGSVTNQGRIDFPSQHDLSIVDAVALAGGQTRLADLRSVKLTRIDANGQSTVTTIDVDAMMKKQGAPLILQPGDIVYVPERVL